MAQHDAAHHQGKGRREKQRDERRHAGVDLEKRAQVNESAPADLPQVEGQRQPENHGGDKCEPAGPGCRVPPGLHDDRWQYREQERHERDACQPSQHGDGSDGREREEDFDCDNQRRLPAMRGAVARHEAQADHHGHQQDGRCPCRVNAVVRRPVEGCLPGGGEHVRGALRIRYLLWLVGGHMRIADLYRVNRRERLTSDHAHPDRRDRSCLA